MTIIFLEVKLKLMNKLPKGQALLITLLIMAVALTIGLSIASRSVTDIRISQQTEEAARAFSAAEAGIEEALITETGGTGGFAETGASYQTATQGLGEGETEFAFPGEYNTNEIQTLWLADHETLTGVYNGNALEVYWGKPDTGWAANPQTPALEVSVFYRVGSDYRVARYALDPRASANANKFCDLQSGSDCAGVLNWGITSVSFGGKTFQFRATLDLSSLSGTLLFARLRLLYSTVPQALGAKAAAGSTFPSQGIKIESTGQAGGATRKVEVSRLWPAPLSILDFVLYSTGGLTK